MGNLSGREKDESRGERQREGGGRRRLRRINRRRKGTAAGIAALFI